MTQAHKEDMLTLRLSMVRCALYMPANNPRAVAKAGDLNADLIIFDLEDAVAPDAKDAARAAAIAAAALPYGDRLIAIRANGFGSSQHEDDVAAIMGSAADILVLPKVESALDLDAFAKSPAKPIIAMIETCAGLYAAREITAHPAVVGLFAGTNDLAAELGIDLAEGREGLNLSLQMMVLAARAAGKVAFDGVNNNLDDMEILAAEAMAAKRLGFTGKTAIHPRQIAPINDAFSPSLAQIDDAKALVAAASGGAERFRGRMIEAMHVDAAHRLLARAKALATS